MLYVNSLVSKFDELKVIGQGIFYILIINETTLDASFPVNQFFVNGFSKLKWRWDNYLCTRRYYKQNVNKT